MFGKYFSIENDGLRGIGRATFFGIGWVSPNICPSHLLQDLLISLFIRNL